MAKDFLGNELNIGDEVIFVLKNYREFKRGTIISITNQTVVVLQENNTRKLRQNHTQVIKLKGII